MNLFICMKLKYLHTKKKRTEEQSHLFKKEKKKKKQRKTQNNITIYIISLPSGIIFISSYPL